jgi:hypothetical protein
VGHAKEIAMRRLLPALLIVSVIPVLCAYDVNRSELQTQSEREIEFINYEGPHERIDSASEIRGIGEILGAPDLSPGESNSYFSRYRVIRAVDPEVDVGLDADIFVIGATAQVDHIDNLRLMMGGYLQTAFQYSRADAGLLSRFITIYNAVFRNDLDYVESRYKPVVLEHVTAGNVGLSVRYDEWAGQSRILIPLTEGAAPGRLDSVSPSELVGTEVIQELRARRDMGIADRKAMIDLLERIIEERETEIQEEREAIAEAEEDIEQREEELEEEREQITEEREEVAAAEEPQPEEEEELAAREEEAEREEEAIAEERQELEEREEAVEEAEEEVDELTETVQRLYDETATDQRLLLDQAEEQLAALGQVAPVTVIQVTERSGTPFSRLVQINPNTGSAMLSTEVDTIVGRRYLPLAGDLLVLLAEGDAAQLAVIDSNTLTVNSRGEDSIFVSSILETRAREEATDVYAVVSHEGEWYLGRFNEDLQLVERSAITVNPYTVVTFSGERLYVQRANDDIVSLSVDTMEQQ